MTEKNFPINPERLAEIIRQYPTPFHIYDEKAIRANARKLVAAFSRFPVFTEFFAVKALPNPFIMKILAEEGFGEIGRAHV
jgi:diaminopimelate decarboxylase